MIQLLVHLPSSKNLLKLRSCRRIFWRSSI